MSEGVATIETPALRRERSWPVLAWACAGGAVVLLQLYIYSAWILSGQAVPVGTGADAVPAYVRYGILTFEVLNLVAFAGAVVWLVRSVRRNHSFSLFQLLMVGWLLTYWQDPWLSARFPIFIYNTAAYNLGCWCRFLPGWVTPRGDRFPEPLLTNIPAYLVMLPAAALPGLYAVRETLKRRPSLGLMGRYLAALAGVLVLWIPLELIATVLIHVDIWPGSFRSLSFWSGRFYEIPVYEFVFFPAIIAGCSMLLLSGKGGPCFVECGLERLPFGGVRPELTRVLAVTAYANLMNAI